RAVFDEVKAKGNNENADKYKQKEGESERLRERGRGRGRRDREGIGRGRGRDRYKYKDIDKDKDKRRDRNQRKKHDLKMAEKSSVCESDKDKQQKKEDDEKKSKECNSTKKDAKKKIGDDKDENEMDVEKGPAIPVDSLVARAREVNKENVVSLLKEFSYLSQCYSYIRKKMGFSRHYAPRQHRSNTALASRRPFKNNGQRAYMTATEPTEAVMIPAEAKHIIAENAPLEDVLWWYEELHSVEAEAEVLNRLQNTLEHEDHVVFSPESQRSNYGKIMERLLSFRQQKFSFVDTLIIHAEKLLKSLRVPKSANLRCAVLGDASGSMEVAIKSASIIASLLSVALDADLTFFNSNPFPPPVTPRNVKQTIEVVEKVEARGGTSMASALNKYYENKQIIDLFILVSDEGENEKYNGHWFHELFQKYLNEVNSNCKLFLVSFVKVGENGKIMQRLRSVNLTCKQFRLHPKYPDTSKFDSLLGMITLTLSVIQESFDTLLDFIVYNHGYSKTDGALVADVIFSYIK
ncbi:hypothetical protein RFI_22150, partial [Reticulomyxa filosa]